MAAVGTLAAEIAHQINNPIGAIVAASQFALMAGGEDEAEDEAVSREALSTVVEEARRCGRIVKSVLQFARDEPAPKWVDGLSQTVRRASELSRDHVERLGGRLAIETSEEVLPVRMSPIDIEQVMLNLIRNAAESREDGADVVVETFRNLDTAEIRVSDNGRGIPVEMQSHVFDPFYATRRGSGTGARVSGCQSLTA